MLSAWLLTLATIFAQNSDTQKGDVNRDGVINESDVPALIKIMRDGGGIRQQVLYYWYVGTTQPDSSNYPSLVSTVSSYNTQYEFTTEQRQRIYIIVESSKTVQIIDPTLYGIITITEISDVNIPNHKVYKSAGISGRVLINVF